MNSDIIAIGIIACFLLIALVCWISGQLADKVHELDKKMKGVSLWQIHQEIINLEITLVQATQFNQVKIIGVLKEKIEKLRCQLKENEA